MTPPDWILHAYREAADLTVEAKQMHARLGNTTEVLTAYRRAAQATAAARALHDTPQTKGHQ